MAATRNKSMDHVHESIHSTKDDDDGFLGELQAAEIGYESPISFSRLVRRKQQHGSLQQ